MLKYALYYLTRLASESADREIERRIHLMERGQYRRSLLSRMIDHPVGFLVLLLVGLFAALGVGEILCALVGAPFDPRIG